MTSKEALEKIIEKTGCMNDTCAHLDNCLKDNKCRYNDANLMCPDYEMANHIKQDLERLEKLEKENQELKDKLQLTETARQLLYNELKCCNGMAECAQKLKEVIKFLGEQLGLDVDLENHDLITDDGTIGFVNADSETMSILELLNEVLENE